MSGIGRFLFGGKRRRYTPLGVDVAEAALEYPMTVRSVTLTTEQDTRNTDVLSHVTRVQAGTDQLGTYARAEADDSDWYEQVGYTLQHLAVMLAYTGQATYFDEIDTILQKLRANLAFGFRGTSDGTDGTHDISTDLLIWVDKGTSGGSSAQGKDTWFPNNNRACYNASLAAYIYNQNPNRAVTSYARPARETAAAPNGTTVGTTSNGNQTEGTAADRAQFWTHWLQNHWEYKWRSRWGANTTPGSTSGWIGNTDYQSLAQAVALIQTQHSLYDLTGTATYATVRDEIATEAHDGVDGWSASWGSAWMQYMNSPISGSSRECTVFSRFAPGYPGGWGQYLMPVPYLRGILGRFHALNLMEVPLVTNAWMTGLSHSVADMTMDDLTVDSSWTSGVDIGGDGVDRAGIPHAPRNSTEAEAFTGSQTFVRLVEQTIFESPIPTMIAFDNQVNSRHRDLLLSADTYFGADADKFGGLVVGRFSDALANNL